jgi:hypothetical protein
MSNHAWHKLKGCAVLKSNKDYYHVIFDRPVDWAENMRVIDWTAIISHNDGYVSGLQCNASNVRQLYEFSERDLNRRQRVIYNHGSQKWQIEQYFEFQKMVKNLVKKVSGGDKGKRIINDLMQEELFEKLKAYFKTMIKMPIMQRGENQELEY